MKKMKVHIDKYLENFKEKMESTVDRLKQIGTEYSKLCDSLSQEQLAPAE